MANLEIAKTEIRHELTKAGYNYQVILQSCEDIQITEDNLEASRKELAKGKELLKKINELENPYTASWKAWNENRKSVADPLNEVLQTKAVKVKAIADAINARVAAEKAEETRKKNIQETIGTFLLESSVKIAEAITLDQLIDIERRVNLETTNKSKYQEFLPSFKLRCEAIRDLLKAKKEKLRELAAIEREPETDDYDAAMELFGRKEYLEAEIKEGNELVTQKTIANIKTTEVVTSEGATNAVKPKRTVWKAKIENLELAFKYEQELLDISLNSKRALAKLASLNTDGKDSFFSHGILYYKEFTY